MGRPPKFPAHPDSAPGDFYVIDGECIHCGVPHELASDLIGWGARDDGTLTHCIWKKQPSTPAELERAFAIFDQQDLGCHRYAGSDPLVLARLYAWDCDYSETDSPEQDEER